MSATTRRLLLCGAVAGPLFVVAFLVEGATRANYNPLRHPVSSLELGDSGWTQSANFIVVGLLTLAFAVGLWRALRPFGGSTLGPVLVGAHALGLVGAGLFITDPVSGYPLGTPDKILQATTHGTLHDLVSIPTFVGWPIACIVLAVHFLRWRKPGWAVYSAATALVFMGAFVLASMGFSQVAALVDLGGLFQRTAIIAGFTWITLLAVHLLTTTRD
ncbi:DUF998 domain-containing protein [Sphaerisporangium corydalis]|uniref:DUF998 domain-containing protein n=1 Tax=Sphaerisporangium corydalis TaxID=1441875 RepID=A0ABV9EN83_9ACTN|nr:DUF998 domain-containing protein [Sphaerisporangium corydalis]